MNSPVAVANGVIDEIHDRAADAYPEECCGFLLSPSDGGSEVGLRRVVGAESTENRSTEERRRRFVIPPDALKAAEERARATGFLVCGFYHSHPDHPAEPSQYDQEHAWPWYTYLIVGVTEGPTPGPIGAFELEPERRSFRRVEWAVEPARLTPRGGVSTG